MTQSKTWLSMICAALLSSLIAVQPVAAQSPFEGGWTLNTEMSNLSFQSVKKQTVVESSGFATFQGTIDESGMAKVTVLLDSVDTKIDLRNVRMRFLFFETFKFPEATITAQINPADIADLATVRRKKVAVDYTVDLHGVQQSYQSMVTATLLTDDLVSIASATPISVPVADFNLTEGLGKLQDAANVEIIPSATVSFDWVFARNTSTLAVAPAAAPAQPANAALEAEGDFDKAACKGRFEILSRTGNIYFASGSSRLENKSGPLLDSLASIMSRCPGMIIEVGGHTDSVGSAASNQRLSEFRAASVVTYLEGKGLAKNTMVAKGYGETQPIADNATKKGRWDNRRIEFKVLEN
ncbi:OmpA family protein [Sulfitobacter sp. M368]|uniref:OmpA family protein n=1 Tax=Sulfitobacter sp. M368 TaxID=2867021 RepID=UPI0021A37E8F|nr:OmpA family protein [Sulfitobacter sp. M368]